MWIFMVIWVYNPLTSKAQGRERRRMKGRCCDMAEMRESNSVGKLTGDVDVSQVLKGLKAVQREAKKTIRILQELEEIQNKQCGYATIETVEGGCPICGSNRIEKTTLKYIDGNVHHESVRCMNCGCIL